ncbi:hypothetical protein OG612_44995 (plasmid) [Streptomyces sp. NBC_01527]|uniref:DUF6415 family natural product biosynthesis protein n=1 Tax=Streptomyces sp. NBC_01527 TaxID=2903894 RepID=UPI002F9197C1
MTAAEATESDVPKWAPPLDADGLRFVLKQMATWTPLDVKAIFDDLEAAIGYQVEASRRPAKRLPAVLRAVMRRPGRGSPAAAPATVELVVRLRSHLARLGNIAVADPKFPPTDVMVQLVERGRPMRDEHAPGDQEQTLALARRLAFVLSDLVEELIEARYIEDDE